MVCLCDQYKSPKFSYSTLCFFGNKAFLTFAQHFNISFIRNCHTWCLICQLLSFFRISGFQKFEKLLKITIYTDFYLLKNLNFFLNFLILWFIGLYFSVHSFRSSVLWVLASKIWRNWLLAQDWISLNFPNQEKEDFFFCKILKRTEHLLLIK
jgi:hypothetical protein